MPARLPHLRSTTSPHQASHLKLCAATISFGASVNISNASFETPGLRAGPLAYSYAPAGSDWTYTFGGGIAANGSNFNNANAPDGTQAGFLQGFEQTLSGLDPVAMYFVSFQAVQRNPPPGANYYGGQDFQVFLDNLLIGTFSPVSATAWSTFTTDLFTPSATAGTLKFAGLDSLGGDRTAFVDAVQVQTAVPEPASIGLIGLGLTTIALWRRR